MKIRQYLANYWGKIKNNLFYQNIAVVAGGNAAAKVIGILAAPIITRIYTPEDYGIFSVLLSVTGIAGSIATLRYAVTIPLPKDEKLADNLLRLSFLITLSLSLLWVVGIITLGDYLAVRFSAEKITPFLWILPVVFLGQGLYQALSNWAVREKKFRLITRTKITQGISSATVKIGLGVVGVKPLGLLVGNIVQEFAGIGSFLLKLLRNKPDFFKYFSWAEIKYAARRYKDFPLIQSWSQLLLNTSVNLPVIIIGAYYGAAVVGIFGLAHNMINIPMNLLGKSVSQVYFGEISKFGKNNPEKIYRLSISVIKKMFWIASVPMALLIAFGPWIFKVFFGTEWLEAGVYARYLALIILTRFISSPIMHCLNVLEKQGIQLFLNLLRIVLVVLIFVFAHKMSWDPKRTIIAYSILISLFYIVVIRTILYILKANW